MVREVGHAAVPRFNKRVSRPEGMTWEAFQRELVQMRLTAKIAQVESAIRKPIEQATWSVAPNGAPQEIVDLVSHDLRLPVEGEEGQQPRRTGRVSWDEHLKSALEAIFTGVAFFEQVYEVGADGRNHLRKLAPRPNLSIRSIETADDGGLVGIRQRGINGHEEVFIPVNRLVAYRHGSRDGTWEGASVFAPARDNWLELQKLQALNSLVLQRNGMGIPKYKASQLTDRSEVKAEMESGQQLAEAYAAGSVTGYSLPPGAEMPVEGVTGQLPDIPASMEYHANQIAIACNATHLNLTGGGGSYALASVQLGEFIQGLQSMAEWIADTASQHIVEDLVRVAFPEYEGPTPFITSTRIQVQKDLTPGDISQLAAQGVLTKEPNLEQWVRSSFRIPKARSLFEALKAKKSLSDAEEEMGVSLTSSGDDENDSSGDAGSGESMMTDLADIERRVELERRYDAALDLNADLVAKVARLRGEA
nr:MAG TPA: Portal protein [Caudoviricetes sp.]